METGHNSRITPGTHSLLGGQGCRVFRKIAHRLFYSAWESNSGFLGCEPSVLPLHHGGPLFGLWRQSSCTSIVFLAKLKTAWFPHLSQMRYCRMSLWLMHKSTKSLGFPLYFKWNANNPKSQSIHLSAAISEVRLAGGLWAVDTPQYWKRWYDLCRDWRVIMTWSDATSRSQCACPYIL